MQRSIRLWISPSRTAAEMAARSPISHDVRICPIATRIVIYAKETGALRRISGRWDCRKNRSPRGTPAFHGRQGQSGADNAVFSRAFR
jgi:hypothetical protein